MSNLQQQPTDQIRRATDLAEVEDALSPRPLRVSELEEFFVETDDARDPHQNTLAVLHRRLMRPGTKVLFSGNRGTGKSTIISKFCQKHSSRDYTIVQFGVRAEGFHEPTIADLLLLIAERLATAAKDRELTGTDSLAKVFDYFKTTIDTLISRTSTTGNIETTVQWKTPAGFQWLSGLFTEAKGTAKIQGGVDRETKETQERRKRITDLSKGVNALLHSVSAAAAAANLPPILLIIEDLDKVGFGCAKNLFLDNPAIFGDLSCSVLFTAPVSLHATPVAGALDEKPYSRVTLPMIRVVTKDGSDDTAGLAMVREIVMGAKGRVEPHLFSKPEVLDHAIRMTGGILRQLFEVLADAANAAIVERDRPTDRGGRPKLAALEKSHVDYGLAKARKKLLPMISLNGVDSEYTQQNNLSVETLYGRLREIYTQGSDTGAIYPADPILLEAQAIVEYNGEGYRRIHPLLSDIIEKQINGNQDTTHP